MVNVSAKTWWIPHIPICAGTPVTNGLGNLSESIPRKKICVTLSQLVYKIPSMMGSKKHDFWLKINILEGNK